MSLRSFFGLVALVGALALGGKYLISRHESDQAHATLTQQMKQEPKPIYERFYSIDPAKVVKNVGGLNGNGMNLPACFENAARWVGHCQMDGFTAWCAIHVHEGMTLPVLSKAVKEFCKDQGVDEPETLSTSDAVPTQVFMYVNAHHGVVVADTGYPGTRYPHEVAAASVVLHWEGKDVVLFDPNYPRKADKLDVETVSSDIFRSRFKRAGSQVIVIMPPEKKKTVVAKSCPCGESCDCVDCHCNDATTIIPASFMLQVPATPGPQLPTRDQGPVGEGGRDQGPINNNRWNPNRNGGDAGAFGLEELAKAIREVKEMIWSKGGTADSLQANFNKAHDGATLLIGINLGCNVLQTLALLIIAIASIAIFAKMPSGQAAPGRIF